MTSHLRVPAFHHHGVKGWKYYCQRYTPLLSVRQKKYRWFNHYKKDFLSSEILPDDVWCKENVIKVVYTKNYKHIMSIYTDV